MPGQHPGRLLGVAARAGFEPVRGWSKPKLVEEHLRQLPVVVLARVQHHLLRPPGERERDRAGLDELRPVSDDGQDLHPRVL